jgi:hypothetical protein
VVQGEMGMMKGVWIGNMYNMKGITIIDGCNSSIFSKIGVEEEKTLTVSEKKAILWHQRPGHIREKGLRLLHGKCMV